MTENRRIFLNIVATYGRSLYALIIGLFCGRWTLMALGEVDYGLMGVVGGLTAFIAYFNGILGGAIGRFYALSVGEQKKDPAAGLEACRMWFTTAVVIHTVVPVALMCLGYPMGEWAVRHFLTIPPDRVEACVWVWRCVCATCFLGMVTLPFSAMYGARQYIAELTIYSFVTTTLNVCVLYYMLHHPGVWLAKYALAQGVLAFLPQVIIAVRAYFIFPECRVVRRHLNCLANVKRLCSYAFWNAWGTLGAMLRAQGDAVLLNKYFGPKVNAGFAVGSNLSGQTNTLSGSLIGAFSPAIFNAWGAGDYDRARQMAYQTCKLGALFILVFAIPLTLEVEEVLHLWLKQPPQYAAEFCVFVLAMNVIDKLAVGHMICVNANGKVALYQAFLGTSLVMTLPIAWGLIALGVDPTAVGWAMVTTMVFCATGRVWFARTLVGMSAKVWLRTIVAPIALLIGITGAIGYLPQVAMAPSFLRVVVTTGVVEAVLLPFSWCLILNSAERAFVRNRLSKLFNRASKTVHLADKALCCGCAACHDVCPKGAIRMVADREGFRYPQIDATACVHCGRCEAACPVLHPGEAREPQAVYAAKALDTALRLDSSSGGIFSLLAQRVLARGGRVYGAAYDEADWSVHHIAATDEAGLAALRGSKYLQSRVGGIYRAVKADLAKGLEVLFSGTPCQIAALKRVLGRDMPRLVCVEVVCHAVPSPRVWQQYLLYQQKNFRRACGSTIRRISARRKHCGWQRYSVSLRFANNTEYLCEFSQDPFMQAFLRELCNRPSCHACSVKALRSGADLTIGDFWGIGQVLPEMDDDRGTSCVLVNTARGAALWGEVQGALESRATTYASVLRGNSAILHSTHPHPNRARFMASCSDAHFPRVLARCLRPTVLCRVKSFVRRVLRRIGVLG